MQAPRIDVAHIDTSGARRPTVPARGEIVTKETILERRIREAEEQGQRIGSGAEELNAAAVEEQLGVTIEPGTIEVEETDFEGRELEIPSAEDEPFDPGPHPDLLPLDEIERDQAPEPDPLILPDEVEPEPIVRPALEAKPEYVSDRQDEGLLLDISLDTTEIRADLGRIMQALLVVGASIDELATERTKPWWGKRALDWILSES